MIVYGKDCDPTIYKRSTLCVSIQTNMLEKLIEWSLLGTEGLSVAHFFVRHWVFVLNRSILRSFGESKLNVKKSEQLSFVNSKRECAMCFWNFEQ